jgi:superfamily II DNA or RNA helicase
MNRVINIELGSQISLTKSELSKGLLDQIRSYLTLENPKYRDADEHGYSTFGMARSLYAYHETDEELVCSRGYAGNLIAFLKRNGFQYRLIDHRRRLPDINLTFLGTLRGYQERAVGNTLKKDFGIVVAPCGAGKTVIACAVMAARRQPTLIITHTKELLNQWIDRIEQYLGIPKDEIGVIGGGKEIIKPITVGMVQTLCKRNLGEIRQHFGQIIIDECHHTPASTFLDVAASFDCQYMLGLSATPYRRDGLNKLIYVTLGNVAATITDAELQDSGCRIKPEIVVRETCFDFDYCEDSDYQPMISELVEDADRNELIISDVIQESQENRNLSLILSDRKSHCEALAGLLRKQGIQVAVLTSDRSKSERGAIIRDIESGALKVVCATGALAGEGLDFPKLNRLFVTTPIRFKGRITQYVGRALRVAEGKTDVRIYDYVDSVGVLQSSYRSRQRVYEGLN